MYKLCTLEVVFFTVGVFKQRRSSGLQPIINNLGLAMML